MGIEVVDCTIGDRQSVARAGTRINGRGPGPIAILACQERAQARISQRVIPAENTTATRPPYECAAFFMIVNR